MLPIRKIVLYKHGIGYFERLGEVKDDATIELYFKADEMNDVLKSLTVLDLSQGVIRSISYESTTPVEKQLADIAIRLPDHNSLTGLLSQVKGARVAIEVPPERYLEGVIVGVETVNRRSGRDPNEANMLSLLVDGVSLQSFDMLEIERIVFMDDSLKRDLQHLLDTLISSKKKDLRKLTIYARGIGVRDIMASYIAETPVWKTSYRMLLGAGMPMIQGWAIVDNTQDEDWEDVSLTLVSGQPISFIHDLYSTRHKRRPEVAVEDDTPYNLPPEEPAAEPDDKEEAIEDDMIVAAADSSGVLPLPPQTTAKGSGVANLLRKEKAAAQKDGSAGPHIIDTGDLFQYDIRNEVTVKRNQSALVPILHRSFEGKRVAVYNADIRERNPMSAVKFRNTSGMTLEGGPVTVLEDEIYVGESMIETMKPGEEKLVPYAVELGCQVLSLRDNQLREVHLAQIYHGTLYLHRHRIVSTSYQVHSTMDDVLDLHLQHRYHPDWELIDTEKPDDKNENFYTFRVKVAPGEHKEFVVQEKGDATETWSIQNVEREDVAVWLEKKYVDRDTWTTLNKLADINERISTLEHWVKHREKEIEDIFGNQKRLRENLSSLGDSQGEQSLRERYIDALSSEEDRLRDLRAQIKDWQKEKSGMEREQRSVVRGLQYKTSLM